MSIGTNATFVVKMMRKSKTATRIVCFFVKPWTDEMAYRMEVKEKGNYWGNILMFIGLPICKLLGKIINFVNPVCLFEMATVFLFGATIDYKIINNKKMHGELYKQKEQCFKQSVLSLICKQQKLSGQWA